MKSTTIKKLTGYSFFASLGILSSNTAKSQIIYTDIDPVIAGGMPDCYPPLLLGAVAINTSSAKLKWAAIMLTEHYELQYRPVGTISWTTKVVDGMKSFRNVVGLDCNVSYEWRIRSFCFGGEISAFSAIQTFTTLVCRIGQETKIDDENTNNWSYANFLHVEITEDILENTALILFDETGRKVFEKNIFCEKNIFELDLPQGIYVATIKSVSSLYSRKVGVQY